MVRGSYLVYYKTLLQNSTDDITKCHSYSMTKCDKNTKHIRFFITKCNSFIKKCFDTLGFVR